MFDSQFQTCTRDLCFLFASDVRKTKFDLLLVSCPCFNTVKSKWELDDKNKTSDETIPCKTMYLSVLCGRGGGSPCLAPNQSKTIWFGIQSLREGKRKLFMVIKLPHTRCNGFLYRRVKPRYVQYTLVLYNIPTNQNLLMFYVTPIVDSKINVISDFFIKTFIPHNIWLSSFSSRPYSDDVFV